MNYNDIEWLGQRFEEHAIIAKKHREDLDVKYPDRDKGFDDEFMLPVALAAMCRAIKELQDDNDTSKDQEVAGTTQASVGVHCQLVTK